MTGMRHDLDEPDEPSTLAYFLSGPWAPFACLLIALAGLLLMVVWAVAHG